MGLARSPRLAAVRGRRADLHLPVHGRRVRRRDPARHLLRRDRDAGHRRGDHRAARDGHAHPAEPAHPALPDLVRDVEGVGLRPGVVDAHRAPRGADDRRDDRRRRVAAAAGDHPSDRGELLRRRRDDDRRAHHLALHHDQAHLPGQLPTTAARLARVVRPQDGHGVVPAHRIDHGAHVRTFGAAPNGRHRNGRRPDRRIAVVNRALGARVRARVPSLVEELHGLPRTTRLGVRARVHRGGREPRCS